MDFLYFLKESTHNSPTENTINNNNTIKAGEKVLDLLIEIPFIKELPFMLIKQISHEFTKKSYKKKEYVLKQGDPINDIYLILKGGFTITLNHYREYDVEQDIDTFIKYQNITCEPFNIDRNYEIKGKINKKEEIELFIYQKKNFFGDVEIVSNNKYSLFNIRASEDNSIVCMLERNKWCDLIMKIRDKFNKDVINKIDILQERIKDILLKKKKLKFDKLKLSQDKIYFQLVVNNNYNICNQKLNNIDNHIINNRINKNKKKHYIKKNLSIININNTKSLISDKSKKNIQKSKSVLNIKNYHKKVMDLFKFPTILKNETKTNFKKFFDNLYSKKDKKKVKLTETKIDSEPIYINRFKNIFNMSSEKKSEFLNFVKNYLDNNYKKNEYQTPKIKKNKSNINELFTMYNFYVNNTHENSYNTNQSKQNIMLKTSSFLNSSFKKNLRKNKSYSQTPIETKKMINFGNLKNNIHGSDSRIRMKKIRFSKRIINYSNKHLNFGNIYQKNFKKNENKIIYSKIKSKDIKFDDYLNKNKKKLIVNSSLNNIISKKEKITTKTIFELLLKNKSDNVKLQMLESIGGGKVKDIDNKININNNIDVRNEEYIKKLFFGEKYK